MNPGIFDRARLGDCLLQKARVAPSVKVPRPRSLPATVLQDFFHGELGTALHHFSMRLKLLVEDGHCGFAAVTVDLEVGLDLEDDLDAERGRPARQGVQLVADGSCQRDSRQKTKAISPERLGEEDRVRMEMQIVASRVCRPVVYLPVSIAVSGLVLGCTVLQNVAFAGEAAVQGRVADQAELGVFSAELDAVLRKCAARRGAFRQALGILPLEHELECEGEPAPVTK